jgi:hypothetical protein
MTRRTIWLSYCGLLLIIAAPYLILGHDAHILVHDNLNQLNMLGIFNGRFAAPLLPGSSVPDFTLQGTPDFFHLAHFKLDKPLFVLGYFPGFVLNELLYRLLALVGCSALLKRLSGSKMTLSILLASLAFAALPYWPQGNGSIAALPLFVLACIDLARKSHFARSVAFIALYALYSNFFFIGVYLVPLMLFYALWRALHRQSFVPLLAGCLLFCVLSALSHFPVFYNHLVAHVPTNRSLQQFAGVNLWQCAKAAVMTLLTSHALAPSLHRFIILPSSIVISIWAWRARFQRRLLAGIWITLFSIAAGSALFFWMPLQQLWQQLGLGFNFSRIYVFLPLLWYLLFALCARWLYARPRPGWRVVAVVILASQLLLNLGTTTNRAVSGQPSFGQFVAREQFDEMKQAMGAAHHNDVVGCIGFYPAMANYNGLRTIGSFSAYYPASYKTLFRNFIAAELAANEELKTYFDSRGSALYLFDDDIGYRYKTQDYPADFAITSRLNIPALARQQVRWIIASVPVANAEQIGLRLVSRQPGNGYYQALYLYHIQEVL